ncbi:MAG: cyclic nucleotide-binding domain-containing protein [Granulosicoccus sp.]|nr:cyclic nucleotide-binding domain-containing protein [Granulosicoccus sp.]
MDFTSIDCFRDLDEKQQAWLKQATTERLIKSGELLVREGEPSHSMYFVVSGRFAISVSDRATAIAQIGAGQTIGEIGFLSGETRTATATAIRDSVVLRLARDDYEALCNTIPHLLQDISRSLAKKLSSATARLKGHQHTLPATVALCPAGGSIISDRWIEHLLCALGRHKNVKLLRSEQTPFDLDSADPGELTQWLNAQESKHDLVIYLINDSVNSWSEMAMRQSDLILLIADTSTQNLAHTECNAVEKMRSTLQQPPPCWLIFSHSLKAPIKDSKLWINQRRVLQFHHVVVPHQENGAAGFEKLARFLCGTATGLVASGGGAYTAAHTGCFKAFSEAGIQFDIVGGASGGSAMLAAMVSGVDHEELLSRTEQMMVKSGALKKFTVPVYSLLDHTHFDQCLRDNYGDRRIEDCPARFFAVSTNLSTGEEVLHDRGYFWKAVRASSSIPGLLPPVVADNGELLVDGGILDSVPVKRMKSIKQGPNIILCFEPNHQSRAGVEYEKLPGRRQLLVNLLRQRSLKSDIDMPGIGSVLTQSMLLNNSSLDEATEFDLVLSMSLPEDLKLNDWHRHEEIAEIGYGLACDWLKQYANHSVLSCFKTEKPRTSPD